MDDALRGRDGPPPRPGGRGVRVAPRLIALALVGCAAPASRTETAVLPGSRVSFQMVLVPAGAVRSRVSGEVRNGGDREIFELGLKVHPLGPDGRPHLEDVTAQQTRRATFNVCYPALPSSAHPGPHASPLAPGERRPFVVNLPLSFDGPDLVRPGAFGAAVIHLLLAP